MGAAITALRDSIDLLTRNPTLLAGAFVSTLIVLAGTVLSVVPLVGGLVFYLVVIPIALTGMVAMTDAGATGQASFCDFSSGITERSVSLMGAYTVLFVVQLVIALVTALGLFSVGPERFAFIMAFYGGSAALLDALGRTFVIVFLLGALAMMIVGTVWQFLDVAVVVGGEDARGSLVAACSLIADRPLSVLGYMLVRWMIIGTGFLFTAGVWVWLVLGTGSRPTILASMGVLLIAGVVPLLMVVSIAYHVAYYRRRMGLPVGLADTAVVSDGTSGMNSD